MKIKEIIFQISKLKNLKKLIFVPECKSLTEKSSFMSTVVLARFDIQSQGIFLNDIFRNFKTSFGPGKTAVTIMMKLRLVNEPTLVQGNVGIFVNKTALVFCGDVTDMSVLAINRRAGCDFR